MLIKAKEIILTAGNEVFDYREIVINTDYIITASNITIMDGDEAIEAVIINELDRDKCIYLKGRIESLF